ncbi:MAG: Hpt domain-containing protein [Desulfovibrio sp.]|nr:Hpt domain-containing protein [Desulfovibrio sp.]
MSVDILDWKEAISRVLNKRDLYGRLLQKFMDMERDSAARIAQALQQQDLEAARQIAHSVKGTSANLGAKALAAAALELEMALKGGGDTTLPLKHFEDALTDTLVAMTAFLSA